MSSRDAIPALLKPLADDCHVMHGGVPATELLQALVSALDQPTAWRTLRVRPGRAVFEIKAGGGDYLVKAYEASFMARMSPLRFCASGRELRTLEVASAAGLPTPRVCALYSARGKPGVNFLVLQKVAGATELEGYLQREQDRLRDDVKLQRRVVTDFAAFVAALHKGGLLHRDLHLRNVLVRPPRAGNPAEFFVIDLAGEEVTGSLPPQAQRRANLAQLALCFPLAPATVRRRFLREYRARVGDSGPERDAAHDIEQQSMQRQFDLNTMRVATCAEASSAIARVEKQATLLLIYRRSDGTDLEQLEAPLARTSPQDWHRTIFDHFELRLGEGSVWKLRSPLEGADENARRRKLEALWGRLLELHAIRAPAPTPLACIADDQQLVVYARIPGPLTPLVKLKDHAAHSLFEDLGRQLVRMHRAGCFFLPLETATLAEGLSVASARRGARTVMLTAPDQIFRGSPTALGPQAVASLGRVGRTLLEHSGERQMKELVWSYARVLRLNHFDTSALLNEARRVPTGNTLVMTRGIEKSRLDRDAG
ncbi:MAG: hypothetical protein KF696_02485 [Planctomycetes bacterium]|nr:hypothetical protein [Planctomycetota bacterium]MCW8134870.1 hypothetical protein [Planctomycetota bacterium]